MYDCCPMTHMSVCFNVDQPPPSLYPLPLLGIAPARALAQRNFAVTLSYTSTSPARSGRRASCCWPCLCLCLSKHVKTAFDKPDKQSVGDDAGSVSSLCLLKVPSVPPDNLINKPQLCSQEVKSACSLFLCPNFKCFSLIFSSVFPLCDFLSFPFPYKDSF